jgi:hypothetical protein
MNATLMDIGAAGQAGTRTLRSAFLLALLFSGLIVRVITRTYQPRLVTRQICDLRLGEDGIAELLGDQLRGIRKELFAGDFSGVDVG